MNKAYAAAALDRAERASRRAVESVGYTHGAERLTLGATDLVWDPFGSSERIARYLRASSELRSAGRGLQQRRHNHLYNEHLHSLERQIAEVEQTRAMIAAICASSKLEAAPSFIRTEVTKDSVLALPNTSTSLTVDSAAHRSAASTSAKGSGGRSKVTSMSRNSFALEAKSGSALAPSSTLAFQEVETIATESRAVLQREDQARSFQNSATRRSSKQVVVQLRPLPCPLEAQGEECPCCLEVSLSCRLLAHEAPALCVGRGHENFDYHS